MRALVYHGPGQKAWEEVPKPGLAIDLADSRLEAAKQFGADVTVNNSREDPLSVIAALTDGLGADTGALKVILSR